MRRQVQAGRMRLERETLRHLQAMEGLEPWEARRAVAGAACTDSCFADCCTDNMSGCKTEDGIVAAG